MDIDEAEIWLRQVIKGGLADKETIKAIEVMLRSYNAILTNYNALEEDMDKMQEEIKEKEEVIEIMQDELKHIPSIVSETM